MFCENCGQPIEDGKQLCAQCAARDAGEETFDLATPLEVTPEKPKEKKPRKGLGKKGKLILLSSLALVLIIAAIIVICSWDHLRLFWKRTFTDPTDYLVAVEEEAANRHAKEVADAYGRLLSNLRKEDRAAHTELQLSVDEQIMNLADQFLGLSIELGWIHDLGLTLDTNTLNGQSENSLNLSLNDAQLLQLQLFTSEDTLWLLLPEMSDQALTGNKSQMALSFDDLPEAAQVEEMMKTFLAIPRTYMKDAEKSDGTVKAGKLEQELWVLSAELSEKDCRELRRELLTEAKTNATLKQLLTAIGGQSAYDDFQSSLDQALTDLEQAPASDKKALTYRVYLDREDRIAGRAVSLEDAEYSCFHLTSGEQWGLSVTADDISVSGDGKLRDSKRSGDITVKNGETTLLSLSLEDFLLQDGTCSGTLRFQPGKKLLTAIGDELGLDESVMRLLGGSLTLDLTLDIRSDSCDIRFGAVAMGLPLAEVRLTSQQKQSTAVTLPEGGVDMTDTDALTQWVGDLDFDPLLDGLSEAGLPKEYLLTLRLLLSQLG